MAEKIMPAAEANVADAYNDEQHAYEFAFHVLPTVAEGEVAGVFESLKAHITKAGGVLFDEEAPKRIDLAYEIEKSFEGKNRRFHSAYFGWVRFRLSGEKLESLTGELEGDASMLRMFILKLTREEEATPFRYHEVEREKKVKIIEDKEVLTEAKVEEPTEAVSEVALDESLEKITGEEVTKEEEK